jgi:uncharacterized LabA/DUF88 family protein
MLDTAGSLAPETGNSALLIDLENFFLAREERTDSAGEEVYSLAEDLDHLMRYVELVGGGRRRAVSRAYANFSAARPGDGERRWEYYLQGTAKTLMERGIEPVQVFRFPGGANKNAADMRLAMDALALYRDNPRLQQVVLVSGDADFIPLILELRKVGLEVVVIGVRGHTKAVLERYCDRFEYFEDLIAADETGNGKKRDLARVAAALGAVLQNRSGLPVEALKPLLHGELGHAFDFERFDCESLGEFIETHAGELGVALDRSQTPPVLALRTSPAGIIDGVRLASGFAECAAGVAESPAGVAAILQAGPAGGATGASAPGLEDPPPGFAAEAGDGKASGNGADHALSSDGVRSAREPEAPQDGEREVILRPHSAYLYRQLLRRKVPKIYIVPWRDWGFIMESTFAAAVDPSGRQRVIVHRDLREELIQICSAKGMDNAEKKVDATLFQLFKAGCFVCVEKGPDEGHTDFHWRHAARLVDPLRTLDDLRDRVRLFVIGELRARLVEAGLSPAIDVEVLSAELDGYNAPAESVTRLNELVGAAPI